MQPKSFGVAKWSTLRSVTSRASGSASTSGSAGPGEVLVAEDDEHRDLDGGQPFGGERRSR